MFRRRLAIWALMASTGAAIAPSVQRATDTIDIGVEDAAGPWSLPDGSGYANDVVVAAFRAAGIKAHLVVLPYARCKRTVIAGEIVACFSMSVEPQLLDVIRFSAQPLFSFSCDFFTRDGQPAPDSIEELPRGAVVGTVLGYEYPADVRARLVKRDIRIEAAESESANLRKLAVGRIAAALVTGNDVKPVAWIAARAGVSGRVIRAFGIGPTPSFIGFSVKHPRGREIATRYDEGFKRLVSSGELDRIRQRWIARAQASAVR